MKEEFLTTAEDLYAALTEQEVLWIFLPGVGVLPCAAKQSTDSLFSVD